MLFSPKTNVIYSVGIPHSPIKKDVMGEAQISLHTLHAYVKDPMGTIVGTAHLAKGQPRDRAEFETTSVASGEYSKLNFNERNSPMQVFVWSGKVTI